MNERDGARFRAKSGDVQVFGSTAAEAFNALMARLKGSPNHPIVIWPYNQGDVFFTDEQQARLQALKARSSDLDPAESAELEDLIAASFEATVARARSASFVKT